MTERNPFEVTPRKPLTTLQRARMFAEHKGICCICGHKIQVGKPWIDEHIVPLAQGGTNDPDNRGPAHEFCARAKTKQDAADLSTIRNGYANRVAARVSRSPMPFGKRSPWKKKIDGSIVPRWPLVEARGGEDE